jgi:hypothetical protein
LAKPEKKITTDMETVHDGTKRKVEALPVLKVPTATWERKRYIVTLLCCFIGNFYIISDAAFYEFFARNLLGTQSPIIKRLLKSAAPLSFSVIIEKNSSKCNSNDSSI